jgi:hypothetical protein
MRHDAINAGGLTAAKSVTGELGGIARQQSTTRQAKLLVPACPLRTAGKYLSSSKGSGHGEFMMSLPIPATNRDAS